MLTGYIFFYYVRHRLKIILLPLAQHGTLQISVFQFLLHCTLAAAQCIVIGPVCGFVAVFVGLLPWWLNIACIYPHQTGFVGKGSDHLQLIKFWPSHTPGKGSAVGKFFGSTLLQPARNVCISLSTFSFHCVQEYVDMAKTTELLLKSLVTRMNL